MEPDRQVTPCSDCGIRQQKVVSLLVHESIMAMTERTIRRLWVLIILLIVLLVGTNAMWIIYENSFEDTVVTQQNDDGINNYIGRDGDITNGDTDS